MNILFVNANLYGHINPTLGLVKKLTEKENQVSYFCSESFSEQVKKMGAKWIGFSSKLDLFLKEYRPTDRHPFFMLMEYMLLYDEAVLPEILGILREDRYDMIICDSYFGGACFFKQIVEVPVVCSHSSFAMSKAPVPERMLVPGFHPQLDHCCRILRRICQSYNIDEPSLEQVFTSKGDLNIVYTTQDFNGDDGVHEPDYLFIGPSSVNEALYFGVPMLALPQVNDQHKVADRLVSMKLGMTESINELSPEILRSKIEALIVDRKIKENCMQISREMRDLAKFEQTICKLDKFVDTWKGRK